MPQVLGLVGMVGVRGGVVGLEIFKGKVSENGGGEVLGGGRVVTDRV